MATAAAVLLAGSANVRAQEGEPAVRNQGAVAPSWREATADAAAGGAFLPVTLGASLPEAVGQAAAFGGYDGARQSATLESYAEVRVWGPLALRASATFSDTRNRLRPGVGGRVQLLTQSRHGASAALGVFYKPEGLTEPEGEIEGVLAVGRRFGRTATIVNLAYGQDPEGNERDGELHAAALVSLSARLQAGVDGRWRFDLGSDSRKLAAANEPTFDLDAGPVVAVVLGPVALTAHAGAAVVRPVGASTRVGAIALAGVGTAF